MPRTTLAPHLARLAAECEIEPYRSSGPGGQKKNRTESAVRVRHVPSGITRVATESRSQLVNKHRAIERVWQEIERRARPRTPRTATTPTRAAVVQRLGEKKRRSATKKLRAAPPDGDD
jgi:ribosome-associated protein